MSVAAFIVDTNVVVAGLITGNSGSPVAQVVDRMLNGRIAYLLSSALLNEYRAVLLRPKLQRLHGLGSAEVEELLVEWAANAIWREPEETAAAPDRGDDHLWALLATYEGSILITGDGLLLDNPPPRSSVITSATWLREFATL